jgi:hypothetical protein
MPVLLRQKLEAAAKAAGAIRFNFRAYFGSATILS